MRTVPPERTSHANRLPRLAVQGSHVKHRPDQVDRIPCCKYLVCNSMQFLVIPDVRHFGGDGEVPSQQPRHACVHQGMGLVVDEQEHRVCHVLTNRWHVLELVPIARPLTCTGNHLLCQFKQRGSAPTPQPYGLQGAPELVQFARSNGFPAWKTLQEARQESPDRLGAGALQQNFDNQQQVRTRLRLSPWECPAIGREPCEQAAAKGRSSPSGETSTWCVLNSHVKMLRARARGTPLSPWTT